jgi:hypothetical protein
LTAGKKEIGMSGKIITLTEIIESKLLKEKELRFYQEQLEKIQSRIRILELDLNLTQKIIKMIESEAVIDIEKRILTKDDK